MNDPLLTTINTAISSSSSSLDRAEAYINQALQILNKIGLS